MLTYKGDNNLPEHRVYTDGTATVYKIVEEGRFKDVQFVMDKINYTVRSNKPPTVKADGILVGLSFEYKVHEKDQWINTECKKEFEKYIEPIVWTIFENENKATNFLEEVKKDFLESEDDREEAGEFDVKKDA